MSVTLLTRETPLEPTVTPYRWRDYAACVGPYSVTDDFYPHAKAKVWEEEAIAICNGCLVRRECLDDALASEHSANEVWGVRGGLSESERKALIGKRKYTKKVG